MVSPRKAVYEEFAQFFEKPTRESLREVLRNNVGEFSNYDFKARWPLLSKVARHLLGIGNSGGGCLVAGVVEKEHGTFEPEGLDRLTDKADIVRGIERYVPTTFLRSIEVLDFSYEASEYPAIQHKKFQAIPIEDD